MRPRFFRHDRRHAQSADTPHFFLVVRVVLYTQYRQNTQAHARNGPDQPAPVFHDTATHKKDRIMADHHPLFIDLFGLLFLPGRHVPSAFCRTIRDRPVRDRLYGLCGRDLLSHHRTPTCLLFEMVRHDRGIGYRGTRKT